MARVDDCTLYSPPNSFCGLPWVPSHLWLVSQARAGLNFGSICEDKPRIPNCLCGCSFLFKFLFSIPIPIFSSHSHSRPVSRFLVFKLALLKCRMELNPILDKRALCMLCEQIYFSPFTDMFIWFLKCTAAILHVLIACTRNQHTETSSKFFPAIIFLLCKAWNNRILQKISWQLCHILKSRL